MAELSKLTDIYPETFFKSPNPNTPQIRIQLRDKINADGNIKISNSDFWTDITIDPNNYFTNLTIEDAGGLQRLQLTLFDKEFAEMEDKITNAILKSRLSNKLVIKDANPNSSDDSGLFECKVEANTTINLRIKFGYSDLSDENEGIYGSTDEDKYKTRVKSDATFLSSPWIYFMIMGVNFKLTDAGLQANITAASMTDTFLTKAKMVRKFAVLKGTSLHIMQALQKAVNKTSSGDITIEYKDDPPLPIANEGSDKEGTLDILIGSANDTPNATKAWRSLKSIFGEYCSKVPPKIFNEAGQVVDINATDVSQGSEKMYNSTKYSYLVKTTDDDKNVIEFYYPDPTDPEQTAIRTYFWRDNATSIVKSIDIESQLDFATLNMQLLTIDTSDPNATKVSLNTAKTRALENATEDITDEQREEAAREVYLGTIQDATKQLEDFDIKFVSNTINVSGGQIPRNDIGTRVAQQLVEKLNQGVFSGTITLPGDPFYLFDENLKPFEYAIKLMIMRPNYINKGVFVEGGTSYLSGYYVVKKITHVLSSSGFDTTLEVQRWPKA